MAWWISLISVGVAIDVHTVSVLEAVGRGIVSCWLVIVLGLKHCVSLRETGFALLTLLSCLVICLAGRGVSG